jgi:alanine racemase
VTEIPEAAMGDEAILLGQSGRERITADDMGAMLDTIGYEIVCDISKRVERLYRE